MSTITFQNQSASDLLKSLEKIVNKLPKKYTLQLIINTEYSPTKEKIDEMLAESLMEENSNDGPFENIEELMKSLEK